MTASCAGVDEVLERQYNNRAAVPEHPRIFAAWEQRSERLRARCECRLDLAYGAAARETLDFFPARGRRRAPLHVFIHGGYWQAMDKRYFSFVAEALTESGTAVAVLNYPLCPEARLADIVHSVRSACGWLWRHAAELDVDGARLQACGHSAGGHLTAMLMATDWPRFAPDLPAALIHSGLAISGLFELEPLRHTSINRALGLDAEAARSNSPRRLAPATRAPLVLAVGARESDEYHRQSAELAAAWRQHGVDVDVLELPGHNHFTVLDELCAASGAVFAAAHRLLHPSDPTPPRDHEDSV